ncbi:MAG: glycosyltransferase family 2 protein [Planctomycetota bacterium]
MTSLSVFFPCFNEQDMIATLTEKCLAVSASICDDYEVIIVNDGSSDETAQRADAVAADNPHVKVVHHPENRGYGAALQSGFAAATKEYVFYTDGDGQFDVNELPKLLGLIADCDIVSGYRLNRQDGGLRKLNAFCWGKLVCFVFQMNIRDIDCAFKLYKRSIFDVIELHSTGALIDTEILARARRRGYTVKQIGVHHYPRTAGTSTGANLKVILRAFIELFKLRKQILQTKLP